MEGARKRYIPVKGDLVLGVVTHKHPDYVRVDINAPELATLSAYAFESATKRNRVAINIGDLGTFPFARYVYSVILKKKPLVTGSLS